MTKQKFLYQILPILLAIVLLCAAGAFVFVKTRHKPITGASTQDSYVAFSGEIYDTIQKNYWNKVSDQDLSNLYLLAAQKAASSTSLTLQSKDKAGVEKLIAVVIQNKTDAEKKLLVPEINNVVLANLQPFARSGLYTQQLTQNLSNEVNNVNPADNLYAFLGVNKNASVDEINKAAQEKSAALQKQNTEAAKQELQKIARAQAALGSSANKQRYDQTGAEPPIVGKVINTQILYADFIRFSPTMLSDFQDVLKNFAGNTNLNSLIIDLRGNIGGDIDLMPAVSGIFIGPGQYAYALYHQGTPTPVQTTTGQLPELARYKKIVVLIDGQTQSSAELMASVLKKYHIAVVVGTKSKGWGTIESVFDLKNQIDNTQHYSVFLVHTLTLGETGQPIEGSGVQPTVDISAKNWSAQLQDDTNSPLLVDAVKSLVK